MRHIANQIAESYLEHRSSNCTYEPVFAVEDPTAHIPTLGVDSGSVGDGDATMMTSPFSSTASSSRPNTKQQQFLVMKCGHCELYNIIV